MAVVAGYTGASSLAVVGRGVSCLRVIGMAKTFDLAPDEKIDFDVQFEVKLQ